MGPFVAEPCAFSSLPQWKKPWREVILSFGTQSLAIALLAGIPLLQPQILDPPRREYHVIGVVPTPAPVNHAPQPVRHFPKPVLLAHLDPPVEALRLPAAQPRPKVNIEDIPAPEVKIASKSLANLPPSPAPVLPKQAIKTNVFSAGSSATPTIARAPSQVQTGGFGDPNGVPADKNTGKAVDIAQKGSYDLPTGPGVGNGTGGANGARGVVASAGFGNGVAISDGIRASRGTVRQAGFGDADVPAPVTVRARSAEPARMTPAEILFKPAPIYTDEARRLHIEGEVLVEAVLAASGKVQVLRVVRGLGHGLDEEAVRRAEQIRFKPALHDGQPADSTVVIHIKFELA